MDFEKLVLGNGAGSVKTMHDVIAMCRSAATRITVGSITTKKRLGNIGEVYYQHPIDLWTLNSLGLPNLGMDEYRIALPYMAAKAHANGKELWASVAGFSPEEYAAMTAACFDAGVDGVELNLSCPNVWGESGRKAIPAFDPEMLGRIYREIERSLTGAHIGKRISAKASPTDDLAQLEAFADVTYREGIAREIVAFNTEGGKLRLRHNSMAEALDFRSDENDPVRKHEGGLAGAALTDKTPGRIAQLRAMLPSDFPLVALGGIFNGANAHECLKAGATGIMCTSAYMIYGPGVFSTIGEGLASLVNESEAA